MRAVILAGGRGMRLRPYTTILPKPLMPVGDRPILELIMCQLARDGFDEFDICVGHLGELIRAYIEEGADLPEGLTIRYHWEKEPLGTAGALRNVPPADGPMLVMNGDILTTLDYGDLVRFHNEKGAALSIATHGKKVELSLGVIEGTDGLVSGYVEKPTFSYDVSMGIYVYGPSAVGLIPDSYFDFPDVVHAAIASGLNVCAYRFRGEWFDVGTPDEYERATLAFLDDASRYDHAQ